VQRYIQAVYPDGIPDVQSALIQGHGRLAPTGIFMPARFRFYYDARGYYHDIEMTWFTLPFMRVHERMRDGHSKFDLGVIGESEDEPKTNRAGTQGYYAELLAWVPAMLIQDERVRWEAIDETSARLYLPGLDDDEALAIHFDPETGLLDWMETRRYREDTDAERRRWRNTILEWARVDGWLLPVRTETQWDDDTPWATWELNNVVLNVDVAIRMAQFGGDVAKP
jgi:hypothetical protein